MYRYTIPYAIFKDPDYMLYCAGVLEWKAEWSELAKKRCSVCCGSGLILPDREPCTNCVEGIEDV